MAYTLTDPFARLRTVLRLSATLFLLLGLLLALLPDRVTAEWGAAAQGPTWPLRLAGVLRVTLAIYFLMAASERLIGTPALITCTVANSLVAITLLVAYLQREMAAITLLGQVVLVLIFALCLVSAVAPLRYLRAELQAN